MALRDVVRPVPGPTDRMLGVDVAVCRTSAVVRPGGFRLEIHDKGRAVVAEYGPATLEVHDGCGLRLNVPSDEVRIAYDFLVYSFGARILLWQRHRFNLHAAMLTSPEGRTVAISGPSGAGKSSTTVSLMERGWVLDGDDIIEVRLGPGGAEAIAVDRPFHLADPAALRAGVDLSMGRPLPSRDKRAYGVQLSGRRRALDSMFILEVADVSSPVMSIVPPPAAIPLVAALSDSLGLCQMVGARAKYLNWAAGLTSSIPITRLMRPLHVDTLKEVADLVSQA